MNLRIILLVIVLYCIYVSESRRSGGYRGGSKGGGWGGSKGGGWGGSKGGGWSIFGRATSRPTSSPTRWTYTTRRPVYQTHYTRPTVRTTTRPYVSPTRYVKTTTRPYQSHTTERVPFVTKRHPTVHVKLTSTPRPIGWNVEKSQAHIIKHPTTHVLGAPVRPGQNSLPSGQNGGHVGKQNGGHLGIQNGGHLGTQNGGHVGQVQNQIKYRPLGQSAGQIHSPSPNVQPNINTYVHPPVHAPIGHPYQPGQVIVVPVQQRSPGFGDVLAESLVWNALNSGYRRHHYYDDHYHHHHHHHYSDQNTNTGSTNVEHHTTVINNHYTENKPVQGHNQNQTSHNQTSTEAPSTTPIPFQYYITDDELMNLTETLFAKEEFNLRNFISLDLQTKTKDGNLTENAPQNLLRPLMHVSRGLENIPTIEAFKSVFDQYQLYSTFKEASTPDTKRKESLLIETFMNTEVMTTAMNWLASKYYVEYDDLVMREALRHMWFNKIEGSTSGFERIFLAEIYPGANLIGAQNWIYFNFMEGMKEVDYLGYSEQKNITEKAWLLKLNLRMGEATKINSTMLVGTSPELEMALYTICFYVRPNDICQVSLGGNKLFIYTHTFRHFGKDLIDMGIIAF